MRLARATDARSAGAGWRKAIIGRSLSGQATRRNSSESAPKLEAGRRGQVFGPKHLKAWPAAMARATRHVPQCRVCETPGAPSNQLTTRPMIDSVYCGLPADDLANDLAAVTIDDGPLRRGHWGNAGEEEVAVGVLEREGLTRSICAGRCRPWASNQAEFPPQFALAS